MSIQVVVLYPMFHHVPLHLIIYEGFFKKWGIPKNKGFYCNIYKNGLLQINENCWLQVRCNYPQLLKTNQKTNAILLGGDVCVCATIKSLVWWNPHRGLQGSTHALCHYQPMSDRSCEIQGAHRTFGNGAALSGYTHWNFARAWSQGMSQRNIVVLIDIYMITYIYIYNVYLLKYNI